jgi:carboxyl-terminal processing protease
MKKFQIVGCFLFFAIAGLFSCSDQDDVPQVPSGLQVQSFIWKGLNQYYLWQNNVPDLGDNRFANQGELNSYLQTKGSPESIFEDLLYQPISKFPNQAVDRFSILVNDYTTLENSLQGISTSTGIRYGLRYKQGSSTELFGWVRYVIPNSDAATKNIKRGDIFYGVNGTQLNDNNYIGLLGLNSFTLNMANYNNGAITPNNTSIDLVKTNLNENPVFLATTIPVGTKKVAYLVYNGFLSNYESQLNDAFLQFKNAGATHLVLDLRYNGGGSIKTAVRLAGMITGQFNGQLFTKEQWNPKVQAFYESNNPGVLVENFINQLGNGSAINSLNLSKVYVLTSSRTASASELVINCLAPYINVFQIGDKTTGKNVGSITLYDSPNFSSTNRNPNHKYAMQPLVLKTANKNGFSSYENGLVPNLQLLEDLGNLNQLGNVNEPLLAAALLNISNGGRMAPTNINYLKDFSDSKAIENPFHDAMFTETPKGFENFVGK